MNKHPLTREMQGVILAVQACAKFLRYYHIYVLGSLDYDWWEETKKFYFSLKSNLPKEIKLNNACFEEIMRYKIEDTLDVLFEELPEKFTFNY